MGPSDRRARPGWAVAGLTCILFLVTVLGAGSAPTAKAQIVQPTGTPRPSYPDRPPGEPVVLERTTLADGSVNTVVALPAIADVYIASGAPIQNYELATLILGYDPVAFGAERILLLFNVLGDEVPDGAIINNATLQLYLYLSNPPSDPPLGAAVRRLTSSWSESSVTWANQPPASAEEYATNAVGNSMGWYYWELTGLVAGWVNGTYPNDGLIIIGNESGQLHERFFHSDEGAPDPGSVPQLIVDYTVNNQPPSVEVNPLPAVTNSSIFTVSWEDEEQGGADIQYYDVQYRYNGGPWVLWQTQTLATSNSFKAVADGLYEFEARGVDELGQVEPFQNRPETTTIVDVRPPFLVPRIWLPFVAGG